MWAKIIVLIAVITTDVRINGLQNDLDIGYSYDHPHSSLSSAVQASLAYYVNIPGISHAQQHFYVISAHSNRYMPTASQFGGIPSRIFGGNTANHGLRHFPPQYSQPLPPNHIVKTLNYPKQPLAPSDSFQLFTHQTDPGISTRSSHQGGGYIIQKSNVKNVQQNNFNNFAEQTYQRSPARSEEINTKIYAYAPHVTVQIEPKPHQRSMQMQNQYRLVTSMASLPMSYDAQLPFPIGVVPIKFRPLPLKTHLRQGLLLPITSYQARDSYMK